MLANPKWEITNQVWHILTDARGMIERRSNWWDGREVPGRRICAAMAVWRAAGRPIGKGSNGLGKLALNKLSEAVGCKDVPSFNDTHSHAEVLAAFDRAISEL